MDFLNSITNIQLRAEELLFGTLDMASCYTNILKDEVLDAL